MFKDRRSNVYLAYLDDGGKGKVKIFGGVLLPEDVYSHLEFQSAMIVHHLFSDEEQREEFKEFHASDLFAGAGAFTDVPEAVRHKALLDLVQMCGIFQLPYVYSAVDVEALKRGPMRSASWVDTAFFMVACGIDEQLTQRADERIKSWMVLPDEQKTLAGLPPFRVTSLMVIDEPEQQAEKGKIRDSFRSIRRPLTQALKPRKSKGNSFH